MEKSREVWGEEGGLIIVGEVRSEMWGSRERGEGN